MSGSDETRLAVAANFLVREFLAVKPGEQMVITCDTATDPRAVQALLEAGKVQKARVAVLTIPQLPYQGALADPYIAEPIGPALKSCDVWFDITFPYIAGSKVHAETMALKRARCLQFHDLDAGGIARLFAGVDFNKLFDLQEAVDKVINSSTGKECRVTNAAGTDVTFKIGRPATKKIRRIDQPGTYTPPGSAVIYPEIETVRGTIVIDAAFHEYFTLLRSQISMKVDGPIREVSGGGTDLKVMDRALKRAGGGKYGSIIHFSHGFHPAARLHGGGENHPDGVVTMQSMWIDGQPIVKDGALALPELAKLEARLEPLAL
jgi:2,5-dihydroxypyridine 5,6-dioxygenase